MQDDGCAKERSRRPWLTPQLGIVADAHLASYGLTEANEGIKAELNPKARFTYTSIRGNSGTGLPTTCPSGDLPHSASARSKDSSAKRYSSTSVSKRNWRKAS
jgi:hypothetical protein